jgi:hypothetical protein
MYKFIHPNQSYCSATRSLVDVFIVGRRGRALKSRFPERNSPRNDKGRRREKERSFERHRTPLIKYKGTSAAFLFVDAVKK